MTMVTHCRKKKSFLNFTRRQLKAHQDEKNFVEKIKIVTQPVEDSSRPTKEDLRDCCNEQRLLF